MDRIDAQIVAELQNNARLSNKELADRVGLAPSSCLERVRKLSEAGVLRGSHADVDRRALGVDLEAMIAIQLSSHAREAIDGFRRHALSLPEVVAVYYLSGANDFMVHVGVRGTDHLREVAVENFSTRSEVAHIETALIFEHHRRWVSPEYVTTPSD